MTTAKPAFWLPRPARDPARPRARSALFSWLPSRGRRRATKLAVQSQTGILGMKVFIAIAATAVLSAGTAYADCSYPTPPDHLPDGNTATLQEIVDAQKAVKEYDKAINAYVACIQLERNDAVGKIAKPGEKPTPDQKKAMEDLERVEVQKHNAAIDQLQSVADRFNEQVKVYKSKIDKSKG